MQSRALSDTPSELKSCLLTAVVLGDVEAKHASQLVRLAPCPCNDKTCSHLNTDKTRLRIHNYDVELRLMSSVNANGLSSKLKASAAMNMGMNIMVVAFDAASNKSFDFAASALKTVQTTGATTSLVVVAATNTKGHHTTIAKARNLAHELHAMYTEVSEGKPFYSGLESAAIQLLGLKQDKQQELERSVTLTGTLDIDLLPHTPLHKRVCSLMAEEAKQKHSQLRPVSRI